MSESSSLIGQKVPDFSFSVLMMDTKETASIAEICEKYENVVLDFYTNCCGKGPETGKQLGAVAAADKSGKSAYLLINLENDQSAAVSFVEKHGLAHLTSAVVDHEDLPKQFEIKGIPHKTVIQKGVVTQNGFDVDITATFSNHGQPSKKKEDITTIGTDDPSFVFRFCVPSKHKNIVKILKGRMPASALGRKWAHLKPCDLLEWEHTILMPGRPELSYLLVVNEEDQLREGDSAAFAQKWVAPDPVAQEAGGGEEASAPAPPMQEACFAAGASNSSSVEEIDASAVWAAANEDVDMQEAGKKPDTVEADAEMIIPAVEPASLEAAAERDIEIGAGGADVAADEKIADAEGVLLEEQIANEIGLPDALEPEVFAEKNDMKASDELKQEVEQEAPPSASPMEEAGFAACPPNSPANAIEEINATLAADSPTVEEFGGRSFDRANEDVEMQEAEEKPDIVEADAEMIIPAVEPASLEAAAVRDIEIGEGGADVAADENKIEDAERVLPKKQIANETGLPGALEPELFAKKDEKASDELNHEVKKEAPPSASPMEEAIAPAFSHQAAPRASSDSAAPRAFASRPSAREMDECRSSPNKTDGPQKEQDNAEDEGEAMNVGTKKAENAEAASASAGPSSPKSKMAQYICDNIREVYRKKNPKKIKTLASLLEKYKGREMQLYKKVCAQYELPVDKTEADGTKKLIWYAVTDIDDTAELNKDEEGEGGDKGGADASSTAAPAAPTTSIFGSTTCAAAGAGIFGTEPAGGTSLFGVSTGTSTGAAAPLIFGAPGTSSGSLFGAPPLGSSAGDALKASERKDIFSTATAISGGGSATSPALGDIFGSSASSAAPAPSIFGSATTAPGAGDNKSAAASNFSVPSGVTGPPAATTTTLITSSSNANGGGGMKRTSSIFGADAGAIDDGPDHKGNIDGIFGSADPVKDVDEETASKETKLPGAGSKRKSIFEATSKNALGDIFGSSASSAAPAPSIFGSATTAPGAGDNKSAAASSFSVPSGMTGPPAATTTTLITSSSNANGGGGMKRTSSIFGADAGTIDDGPDHKGNIEGIFGSANPVKDVDEETASKETKLPGAGSKRKSIFEATSKNALGDIFGSSAPSAAPAVSIFGTAGGGSLQSTVFGTSSSSGDAAHASTSENVLSGRSQSEGLGAASASASGVGSSKSPQPRKRQKLLQQQIHDSLCEVYRRKYSKDVKTLRATMLNLGEGGLMEMYRSACAEHELPAEFSTADGATQLIFYAPGSTGVRDGAKKKTGASASSRGGKKAVTKADDDVAMTKDATGGSFPAKPISHASASSAGGIFGSANLPASSLQSGSISGAASSSILGSAVNHRLAPQQIPSSSSSALRHQQQSDVYTSNHGTKYSLEEVASQFCREADLRKKGKTNNAKNREKIYFSRAGLKGSDLTAGQKTAITANAGAKMALAAKFGAADFNVLHKQSTIVGASGGDGSGGASSSSASAAVGQ